MMKAAAHWKVGAQQVDHHHHRQHLAHGREVHAHPDRRACREHVGELALARLAELLGLRLARSRPSRNLSKISRSAPRRRVGRVGQHLRRGDLGRHAHDRQHGDGPDPGRLLDAARHQPAHRPAGSPGLLGGPHHHGGPSRPCGDRGRPPGRARRRSAGRPAHAAASSADSWRYRSRGRSHRRHQLSVRPHADDLTRLQDHDLVGVHDGADLGNDDHGRVARRGAPPGAASRS